MKRDIRQKTYRPSSADRRTRQSGNASARKSPAGNKPRRRTKKKGVGVRISLRVWIAIIVFILFALYSLIQRPFDKSYETGAKAPGRAYRYAVDISHHNPGNIVWDSLHVMIDSRGNTTKSVNQADDILPVSFVILKASEGGTLKDKKFHRYWKEAARAGYGRGAYHFFRSSKSPEEQARNYIRTVGRIRENDLPPILDIESIHKGCTRKELNTKALTWLRIIGEHYGRTPIVYSYESFINNMLSDEIKENYPLWVAHYREQKPEREGWMMWQFTDKAVVYGIDGLVDLNVISPGFTD